jgi:phosphatidylethanolamine/phosphatidyl-N-methylethanolamine N-methyltransferase
MGQVGGVAPKETGDMLSESKLFLKLWLRNPLVMGAVAPSSRMLAEAIARQVPAGRGPVIELGGGTGAVTEALLAAGVAKSDLVVVELDDELHEHLAQRFTGVRVVKGDATKLRELLRPFKLPLARAIVSGLPLLSMKRPMQEAIIESSFAVLRPGGDFIQFTYSLFSPLPRREFGLVGEPRATIVTNLPPARVWVFRRVGGAALRSEASAGGRGIRLKTAAAPAAKRGAAKRAGKRGNNRNRRPH